MSRALVLLVAAVALVAAASGCCETHETARCGTPAAESIASFTVVTTTGDNGSDADIYFCLERASSIVPDCMELATAADDFEESVTDVFRVTPATPVPPGDLRTFYIHNRGGGVFGADWEMVALRVEATGTSGARWDMYVEPRLTCGDENIDSETRWYPATCGY